MKTNTRNFIKTLGLGSLLSIIPNISFGNTDKYKNIPKIGKLSIYDNDFGGRNGFYSGEWYVMDLDKKEKLEYYQTDIPLMAADDINGWFIIEDKRKRKVKIYNKNIAFIYIPYRFISKTPNFEIYTQENRLKQLQNI